MTYVKKLTLQGFKSFAKKVEIPFSNNLNVILGPNGAGKSNITDAICFVLGRLSAKSMRAARASSLIYNGGKTHSPSAEAYVELLLDNANRTFAVDKTEVSISRTVRKNGISIYKVNNEVKTRQEILELLNQGGIDPNGFNIILQQEISKFAEMHPIERRGVMEEVAGIAIYEDRKNKSLNELNRTDEKLKEAKILLNERTSYLRNLDRERSQALNYESLRKTIERDKAAIVFRQMNLKKEESVDIDKKIAEKENHISKVKETISGMDSKISYLKGEIDKINSHIEQSTGIGQEKLRSEISNEKAEIAGLTVRLENLNQRLVELEKRKENLEKDLEGSLDEIEKMKSSIPKDDLRKLLQSRTNSLSELEEKKDKLDKLKIESLKAVMDLQNSRRNHEYMLNKVASLNGQINDLERKMPKESSKLDNVLEKIKRSVRFIEGFEKERLVHLNSSAEFRKEIYLIEKLKKDIKDLDVCPVCKRKVTAEHIKEVHSKGNSDIEILQKRLETSLKSNSDAEDRIKALKRDLEMLNETAAALKVFHVNEAHLNEKMKERENLEKEVEILSERILSLEKKEGSLKVEINSFGDFEKAYHEKKEEFKELSKKKDERANLETQILIKEKEIDNIRGFLKNLPQDRKTIEEGIKSVQNELKQKGNILDDKEKKEKQINDEFQKLFKKRNSLQDQMRELEQKNVESKIRLGSVDGENNNLKIARAQVLAQQETLMNEFEQYKHLDMESLKLKQSKEEIEARIKRNETELIKIGSVNMRALEVYEQVKEEYEKVNDKVMKLEQEKNEILGIISDIDKKKKNTFMKTFDSLNELFTRNFLRLSAMEAFLSLENRENPFEGGINVDVKLAKGKYLDVNSLSGGQRTLMALSLIFAIQELKPYYFYIFDEIDAALDKKNTERLSDMLITYIKNAQYIIITHNDYLISDAPVLFGVSMQDGVSKVLSLRV